MAKVFKAIGNAVTSVVKAVVNVVSNVVKAVVNVVASVVNFVAQPFMGLLGGMPDVPTAAQETEKQNGVLVQRTGTITNVPVVYGYRKLAGSVVFAETGSTNNQYLWVAYVFCEGLVEGLREVFIDDLSLPTNIVGNLNAGQTVTITEGKYKDRVQLQWFPGVYYDNPASTGIGNSSICKSAPNWKTSMNYNGLAVLFARYEWKEIKTQADADANPFSGNIPEVQVALLGRRVASLLTTASETQTYASTPVRYSTNPAECLLDYLRNPRYGKGLLNSDIHWDSWRKAAVKCNTTVEYVSGISGPILTMNYVVDTGQTIFANVKTMLMGFRAYMPYIQGRYKLKIEDAGNETDILSGVATIVGTASTSPKYRTEFSGNVYDIVGTVTYTGIEKSSKYNQVVVTYVDPDNKFSTQQVVYPELESERQVYITQDGGRENKLDAAFPTITNYAIAKDMARLLFNKSRRQDTCSLKLAGQAFELEPGDNIRIQSNILNFGTDPWRVVSVKINDDMTVDIGCVRNPDDIYPHARANEEDYVVAVFVPKGSIIYYPDSYNGILLGLVPPQFAVFPPGGSGTPTNPPPSDPGGTGGGGVGGNGPGTTPVNPPITPTPVPVPFTAILTISRNVLKDWKNGTYTFETYFKQPLDGLYSYCEIYWRPNVNYSGGYSTVKIETKPGAGGEILWSLGPLPTGLFDVYARCFASDGRASTQLIKFQLSSQYNILQLNPAFNGLVANPTTISADGWSLPGGTPAVPRYDSDIELFLIRPKLTSGHPLSPRRLSVVFQQTQDFNDNANSAVTGFTVYYRGNTSSTTTFVGDTYWQEEAFSVPAGYIPGQQLTFDLAGDFGAPSWPSDIIGQIPDNNQKYEFLVRLNYGTNVPLKQLGPAVGKVEYFQAGAIGGNAYNYIVWGRTTRAYDTTIDGLIFSSGKVENQTITAAFNTSFLLAKNAPPGTVPGMDIVPSIENINCDPTKNILRFRFYPPVSSKFRGFKISYRPVIPGSQPAFLEKITSIIPNTLTGQLIEFVLDSDFVLGTTYEWVITAQISNGSTTVDATNSYYGRSTIIYQDPEYTNLINKFNFVTKPTTDALGLIRSSFPATKEPYIPQWNKIVPYAWSTKGISEDIRVSGTPPVFTINHYYEAKIQLPSTATALIIYRRIMDETGINNSPSANSLAKYYGIGPWERIRITKSTLDTLHASSDPGFYIVSLRNPLQPKAQTNEGWFNYQYEVSAGTPLDNAKYYPDASNWPYSSASVKLSGMRPYAKSDVANSKTATVYAQYLFVTEDASVEATTGTLLKGFYSDNSSTAWKKTRIGYGEGQVVAQTVADTNASFNTAYTAGYRRRLSEAITVSDLNKMVDLQLGMPAQAVTGGSYTQFLQPPKDSAGNDITIY